MTPRLNVEVLRLNETHIFPDWYIFWIRPYVGVDRKSCSCRPISHLLTCHIINVPESSLITSIYHLPSLSYWNTFGKAGIRRGVYIYAASSFSTSYSVVVWMCNEWYYFKPSHYSFMCLKKNKKTNLTVWLNAEAQSWHVERFLNRYSTRESLTNTQVFFERRLKQGWVLGVVPLTATLLHETTRSKNVCTMHCWIVSHCKSHHVLCISNAFLRPRVGTFRA